MTMKEANMRLATLAGPNDDIKRLKDMGFEGVQLMLDRWNATELNLSDDEYSEIRRNFYINGLQIVALSGYVDFLDGDPSIRIDQVKKALIAAPKVGAKIVITWGGFKKPGMDIENARKQVIEMLGQIMPTAIDNNVYLAIEMYDQCVIGTPKEIVTAIKTLKTDNLKIVMDPPNVFKQSDLNRIPKAIDEIVDSAEGNIILAHAKDMLFKDGNRELPYAGAGQMDYPAYIKALRRVGYDYFLVVEHVSPETIESAKDFVLKAMQ
ncbi:TPA: sugar phosphate isomerase/epimerase [Candidatus Poribacteria bacterium]|nr:sugar phosphate isomerase/epimerase [Candidatus Poribacteria bacterium]